jgi:hypothetical protein
MSKFLLNLLAQISKALVNSKIQFLIQKISFLRFWPDRPCGPLGRWPSRPHWPLSSHGLNSTLPAQPACVSMAYLRKYDFSFDSRLLFSAPSLNPPLTHGPRVSVLSSPPRRPTLVGNTLRRRSLRRPLRASDVVKSLPPPSSFPPLIPFKPSLNEP